MFQGLKYILSTDENMFQGLKYILSTDEKKHCLPKKCSMAYSKVNLRPYILHIVFGFSKSIYFFPQL